jgi:hypothetical protein
MRIAGFRAANGIMAGILFHSACNSAGHD